MTEAQQKKVKATTRKLTSGNFSSGYLESSLIFWQNLYLHSSSSELSFLCFTNTANTPVANNFFITLFLHLSDVNNYICSLNAILGHILFLHILLPLNLPKTTTVLILNSLISVSCHFWDKSMVQVTSNSRQSSKFHSIRQEVIICILSILCECSSYGDSF